MRVTFDYLGRITGYNNRIMKRIFLKAIILIGAPVMLIRLSHAQSSQPLPEFNRLKIDDDIEVELVIADRYSAYSDGSGAVGLKVEGRGLVVSRKGGGSNKIKIFTKDLVEIRMDGIAKLRSSDTLVTELLVLDLDGASQTSLVVRSRALKARLDGGSSLDIKGSSESATMRVDGAAKLRSSDLAVNDLSVETDGAASAHVNALGRLNAKADGASGIRFKGEPKNRNFSIDGLASIKSLEDGEVYNNLPKSDSFTMPTEAYGRDGDTTRIKMGKRKLMIIEDKEEKKSDGDDDNEDKRRRMKRVWGGFELGVQGFATPQMNFNMPANYKYLNSKVGESWFFALNTPDLDGHIIRNTLAFTTGLGIVWNNIHFEGNNVLTPNVDSMSATPSPAGVNLSLNKLHTFEITAPLLLKFAPGNHKKANGGFHIAVGGIVHYVANAKVVTETSSGGYNQRVQMNDNFNINPFRVDGTVRIGYDRIKLFANYSLTPYFNHSKAPDVRLFSAGLTLIGF